MELLIAVLLVLVGFILLVWSADLLVDHASELASKLGISTLLVGIIVVGFGTSAPELFVSAVAALQDRGNLALGNALGSNITNIGLVLGSAALVRALPVTQSIAKIDLPIVIATGILAIALVLDGVLSHSDGFILMAVLIAYLLWSAKSSKSEKSKPLEQDHNLSTASQDLSATSSVSDKPILKSALLTLGSIIILMVASHMLVSGAETIARFFGVGELIIGLTIVAIGTSLPELAAAIAAARKGVHDMIIGNIVGSNVFNTLGVLGITGAIQTTQIDTSALLRDFPVMFLFTLAMFICALAKGTFSRLIGGVFLGGYFAYLGYLVFITV